MRITIFLILDFTAKNYPTDKYIESTEAAYHSYEYCIMYIVYIATSTKTRGSFSVSLSPAQMCSLISMFLTILELVMLHVTIPLTLKSQLEEPSIKINTIFLNVFMILLNLRVFKCTYKQFTLTILQHIINRLFHWALKAEILLQLFPSICH